MPAPDALRRETLARLAQMYGRHGVIQNDAAEKLSPGLLRDAIEDVSSVLHALAMALDQAAEGDGSGLGVIAGRAMEWLTRQPIPELGGLTVGAVAQMIPESN